MGGGEEKGEGREGGKVEVVGWKEGSEVRVS